jgi:hypothetical protein
MKETHTANTAQPAEIHASEPMNRLDKDIIRVIIIPPTYIEAHIGIRGAEMLSIHEDYLLQLA